MSQFPPGPNDRLLGMRTMSSIKADVLGTYMQLHRDFGDSVSFRTGPYRLFTFFHPDAVKALLVTHAKKLIRLPRVMHTMAQWNGNSVLIAEGDQWIRQRRLVQPAFQPRRMRQYGQVMVTHAQQLCEAWRVPIDRDGYLDIDTDQVTQALTLSIICRTMFDVDISEATSKSLANDITRAVAILSEVAFEEMQAIVRLPIWIPTRWNKRKQWAIGVLDETIWRMIRARKNDEGHGHDLLSSLLYPDQGEPVPDQQIRDELMTLMLAGHDTTAAALNWVWYNLARFTDVAVRCREEVDGVAPNRDPNSDDIPQLKYLEASIRETLRLYPPATGVFLRQTTSPLEVGGYRVPSGSLVNLSSFVTQRDARWFPDPLRFDPGRFLEPRVDQIPTGAYFPFGAGPRVCIGQSFAMAELILIVAKMLQEYEVTLPPNTEEPQLRMQMALRPKGKLITRWSRRS